MTRTRQELEERYKQLEGRAGKQSEAIRLLYTYLQQQAEGTQAQQSQADQGLDSDPVQAVTRQVEKLAQAFQSSGVQRDNFIAREHARAQLQARYPQLAGNDDLLEAVGRMASPAFRDPRLGIEEKVEAILEAAARIDKAVKFGSETAFSKAKANEAAAVETGEATVPRVRGKMPDLDVNHATEEEIEKYWEQGLANYGFSVPKER